MYLTGMVDMIKDGECWNKVKRKGRLTEIERLHPDEEGVIVFEMERATWPS